MNYISTLILAGTFAISAAHAERTVVEYKDGNLEQYFKLDLSNLDPNVVHYAYQVLPFADWSASSPVEAQALVLYPGYTEPSIEVTVNRVKKQDFVRIQTYVGRSRVVLNKPAASVDLKKMIDLATIQKFDVSDVSNPDNPLNSSIQITADQVMPVVVGKHDRVEIAAVPNFAWCNSPGFESIFRPQTESGLLSTQSQDRAWCSDSKRSICVETCSVFRGGWRTAIDGQNLLVDIGLGDEKKDNGIASQFELRYFTDESELGLPVSLQKLTGLQTPVIGGFEQNLFYFNQVIQFGKVLGVLQESPTDPSKSVLTTYIVIGVKQHSWDKLLVPQVLLGQFGNTRTGMTAGLPIYSQNVIKAIAAELEK